MRDLEINGERVLDVGMTSLEARVVVLARVRGGKRLPVRHSEADELVELLRGTERLEGGRGTLLSHAEAVLRRWYETIGMFLPRAEPVIGASRVVPDRVKLYGWLADVSGMLRSASGPQCVGGSGQAVMDSIDARYQLDFLRNIGAGGRELDGAEKWARNTRRRLAGKIGLVWVACLPRMQVL